MSSEQTAVAEGGGKKTGTAEKRASHRKVAPKVVVLPQTLTIKRLAELTDISPIDAIKQLMRNGIMASVNQTIDFEMATLITSAFEVRVRPEEAATPGSAGSSKAPEDTDPAKLVARAPVVTILGHVDHGKTTLLDSVRKSHVAAGEAGGITQHIGAYQVTYDGREITFLDTPGHEAFTAIRARGARATDIAILIVAADDGVMPQTREALDHARAAGVPIVVAINKIDVPEADPDRVKRQLGEQGLVLEEWGGDVITVPISAIQGDGIEELLQNILAVAEVADLKGDPDTLASGVVIESKLDRNRGPLATVLVQNGTLRIGDTVVAGSAYGRVKAMANERGERTKEAGPSVPVEVMGFNPLPDAGDVFVVVPNEKAAREIVDQRARQTDTELFNTHALTLEEVNTKVSAGEIKELNLVVKADVQGSVEAVCSSLERLEGERVKVRVLHAGSGSITDSDVLLASASNAIVLGFNTSTEPRVERLAEREGVEIRHYAIIYRLLEDIDKALSGILETTFVEVTQGHAEIRAIFSMGRRTRIAGCMVTDGRVSRSALVRVLREGVVIHAGTISSLRHFKEEVNEMATGFECGVGMAGYNDFQEKDVLETYRKERATR